MQLSRERSTARDVSQEGQLESPNYHSSIKENSDNGTEREVLQTKNDREKLLKTITKTDLFLLFNVPEQLKQS